jgi:cytochrome c553
LRTQPFASRFAAVKFPTLTSTLLLCLLASTRAEDLALPDKVEFNRDVRPILAENCFHCHGFDPKTREADRRLDLRDGALAELDGIRAIVPGKLQESDLHLRISSSDREDVMPPPKSNKRLTPREIALLNRWIEQGAEYQEHWAYLPPKRPVVPEVESGTFGKNAIDQLVLSRQRQLGFQHAPEADRQTLIRRLSLDLTGLPPTPTEVKAFVGDGSADAYEKVVERLLASPAFGERLAIYWLDLVRYADSIGYHSDNPRNVQPFRDYVINAFNENKPFDQFTIEQLAGDLLPGAGATQKIASAYNRLNMSTAEGGAQAKEYEAKSVSDRVRSIGTTWLAQTTGCAECHDHKFDPIKAKDFYQLGAFFADINEKQIGLPEDGMPVPTPQQEQALAAAKARLDQLQQQFDAPRPELASAQAEWEQGFASRGHTVKWLPLAPRSSRANTERSLLPKGSR